MARSFSGAAGSHLRIASNLGITSGPLTLSCHFKRSVTSTAGYLIGVSDSGGGTHIQSLYHSAAGNLGTESYNGAGYGQQNIASNDTSWHHGAAAHQSNTSRVIHCDGSQAGPQTTSVASVSPTETCVGSLAGNTRSTATVAGMGMWDVLLTDAEIASRTAGFPARRIRPQSLKCCVPCVRDVQELRTGASFAATGGSVADHPRQYGF